MTSNQSRWRSVCAARRTPLAIAASIPSGEVPTISVTRYVRSVICPSRCVGAPVAVNIAELERQARRLLTPDVYDYYAGGSGRERTLRASTHAWRRHWLMPRVLRDVSVVDTGVRLPGVPAATARTDRKSGV